MGVGAQGDDGQFALSAGLVRPAELAAGQINHALVVTVPCVNATGPKGFAWPAAVRLRVSVRRGLE